MGRSRTRRRRRAPSNSEDEDGEEEMDTEEGSSALVPAAGGSSAFREEEVDTSDPVIAGLRTSMDNLLQLVKDILPTCYTDEKKTEVVNRLKSCMLKLIKSEVNYVEGLKTVDRTAESMSDIEEDADDHAILAHCELLKTTALEKVTVHRNSLKDTQLMKHPHFVRLLKDLAETQRLIEAKNVQQEEDSDGEGAGSVDNGSFADLEDDDGTTTEMIPVTDPITKLPLTDPIRNKYCNHIYGKGSILAMLERGNKTRCPTVGCSNKRWISDKHLIDDPELTVKVQKKIRDANKARANTQRDQPNSYYI